jgi:hypothetical protein
MIATRIYPQFNVGPGLNNWESDCKGHIVCPNMQKAEAAMAEIETMLRQLESSRNTRYVHHSPDGFPTERKPK